MSEDEVLAISNDYIGLVAVEQGGSKFLVDTVSSEQGVVVVEGPSIRWDGELAKTVRRASFPFICKFHNPNP